MRQNVKPRPWPCRAIAFGRAVDSRVSVENLFAHAFGNAWTIVAHAQHDRIVESLGFEPVYGSRNACAYCRQRQQALRMAARAAARLRRAIEPQPRDAAFTEPLLLA
jgi:hypothetical protein